MSIGNRLNTGNHYLNTAPLFSDDENFEYITTKSMANDNVNEIVLVEEQNDDNKTVAIKGNFRAVLKPGEKIIVKKIKEEKINDCVGNFMKQYSQTSDEYATITSREVALSSEKNCKYINFDEWFNTFGKEYEMVLHKMEQMKIDIVNKEMKIKTLIHKYNSILNNNKEAEKMKKLVPISIINEQIKFLLVSFAFIFVSLIGMIFYYRIGFYIIHPVIYLVTLLMGVGWGATAIFSIKNNKVNLYGKK